MWWCLQNVIVKSMLSDATIVPPCIKLQVKNTTVQWIETFPDFNAPIYLFQWNVLFHAQIVLWRQPLLHPRKDAGEVDILPDRLSQQLQEKVEL